MNWVPVIWSVWGASVLLMAIVGMYVARLGKYEEDQIFLSDSSGHAQHEQAMIAMRRQKAKPLKMTAISLLGVTTMSVVAYYLLDVLRQFK